MFMGWPSAVPLDTTLNFMDSALSASATMVLAVLLSGSLHSTSSNRPPEELPTVVLQDSAELVGSRLCCRMFRRARIAPWLRLCSGEVGEAEHRQFESILYADLLEQMG
jgi:hypothetical protein